ncbi:hypothetical protein BDM02DRAFT_3113557 [Thelephora ganbajun]|uniref:Uncharacterized protein n=1 Tax=Thelephora ganbajun TaxID=370292 RepID=A0ACB6ZJ40_THEGA|nr:hypothetical protein BDM02DRAFT_3113557 [Thelephora ganbajun]
MTIYYTLTFCLMVAEVVMFGVLVTPPPYKVRKALFNWLSHSPIVAKVDYGLKIFFIFVKILFVGALEGMWRPVAEAETAKSGGQGLQDVRAETNRAAKFYSHQGVRDHP